jgi:hydroxyquinol 1,2-dioxygenase
MESHSVQGELNASGRIDDCQLSIVDSNRQSTIVNQQSGSLSAGMRRTTTEDDITADVLRRLEATPDPRLREIMTNLVRHLHAFVKDVQLTEAEWFAAIRFLTETGQLSSEKRQEFILLSDTLGVSMVVDLMNHRRPNGATESTVFGPFHREGAPELPAGGNIAPFDHDGVPTIVTGRVLDLTGRPIAGALLDVWQTASNGLYDSQDPSISGLHMRGKFRTDADGQYLVRTVRPVHYQIPGDGPVGCMLRATNRHPWRPAHIHFLVSADGYEPVTTHIFDDVDPYLDSDAVFAVKDSLICRFERHDRADESAVRFGIDRLGMTPPYCTATFDFVLKPIDSPASTSIEARVT